MKLTTRFLLLLLIGLFKVNAQNNIGINTTNPDSSASLHIDYSDKGLLIPRVSLNDVTNTSLDGINTAATGLLIWNTNASITGGNGTGFYFFNGTKWVYLNKNGNNTLDQAYDQGGPGAGRNITADYGAVAISGEDGMLITGTLGSGEIIDNTISGAGVKMFYNPYKSAFRAGYTDADQWDDTNFLKYTFAAGNSTKAASGKGFAVNYKTDVSDHARNGTAFGNTTHAAESNGFVTGNTTKAKDKNAFSMGFATITLGKNSLSSGTETKAKTVSETVFGSFAKLYTPANNNIADGTGDENDDSRRKFYEEDRIFAIGTGTDIDNRSNALEVWKNGTIKINNSYNLPLADGSSGEFLATDGAGNTSWVTINQDAKKTLFTLYADSNLTINSNSNQYYDGFDMALLPEEFDQNGDGVVRVKMVIRYTSLQGTHKLKLRVDDGTGATNIINSGAFTDTGTAQGGVLESGWRTWTFNNVPYEAHLYGKMKDAGDEIVIQNVYIVIKDN